MIPTHVADIASTELRSFRNARVNSNPMEWRRMFGTAPPPHNCEVGDLRGGEAQWHREPVGQCLQGYTQHNRIHHLRQRAEWNGSPSRLPCVLIFTGFSDMETIVPGSWGVSLWCAYSGTARRTRMSSHATRFLLREDYCCTTGQQRSVH